MASNLRVDQITASTTGSVSIGTATFTGGLSGNITGLNVTGVITATTLNQNVTGVVTATGGFVVGTGATISGSTNTITASTNGSERVRITSTGNVGIGTDTPINSANYANLSLVNTNGGQLELKGTSANKASYIYGAEDLNLYTGTGGDIVFYTGGANERARFNSSGNLSFPSGNGIDFSATSDGSGTTTSELLSDYEEGDWTPIASASSGTITSYTSSGRYTKIGRIVTLHFSISISNQGTAGGQYLLWSGAPFTASNTINQMGVGREMNVNGYLSACFIQGNATNGGFYRWDNSGVIVNGTFQAMIVYNVG